MSASKDSEVRATWRHARLIERLADKDEVFAKEYRVAVRSGMGSFKPKLEAWLVESALARRKQGRRSV